MIASDPLWARLVATALYCAFAYMVLFHKPRKPGPSAAVTYTKFWNAARRQA